MVGAQTEGCGIETVHIPESASQGTAFHPLKIFLCKTFLRFRNRFAKKNSDENAPPPPITEEERKAVMDKVEQIKMGMNVKVRGECLYDSFARELSISVRDLVPMERIERMDTAVIDVQITDFKH